MMLTLLQTLVLHRINPRSYLRAYLDACVRQGSKAPEPLDGWLPWNFGRYKLAGADGPPPGAPAVRARARAP